MPLLFLNARNTKMKQILIIKMKEILIFILCNTDISHKRNINWFVL